MQVRIGDRVIETGPGVRLRDLMLAQGLLFDFPCGGRGSCGQCAVEVTPASAVVGPRRDGRPLACQAVLVAACTVDLPAPPELAELAGLEAFAGRAVTEELEGQISPRVRALDVELEPPSIEDQRSDWRRLHDELAARGIEAAMPETRVMAELARRLRADGWRAHLLLEGERVLAPWSEGRSWYGFAVDLGTTTVDVALYDLQRARRLARQTVFNRQAAYGADVVSRAEAFARHGVAVREAASATIGETAEALLAASGVPASSVVRTVVVGNPIMIHILLGLDPAPLARAPYIPIVSEPVRLPPSELGWSFQALGSVETLPLVSAFVGADTVGMILALGLASARGVSLAVDVGTNGEIVLAKDGELYATSAAAGPAFEGAQISCGSRAVSGAIVRADVGPTGVALEVLGGAAARSLCGTALIMAVAGMLEAGVLDPGGRIAAAQEVRWPALGERIFERGGERAFALTEDRAVFVTQRDVRQLQLAKAAIRAAIESLLAETSTDWGEIQRIYLAGNFGAGMSVAAEMRIGLMPTAPLERVRPVGNAALRGAALALLDDRARDEALAAARRCRFLELSGRPDFQERFVEAIPFPAIRRGDGQIAEVLP